MPATSYKATIKNEVLRFSKYNDIKDGDEIKFSTAPLQLTDAQVTWVLQDESRRFAVPQINLQFNYPVKAEDVKDKLAIEVEGVKSDYTIQHVGIGNMITVRLNSFKDEDRNYEAKIILAKGLKPEKGQNSTDEEIKTTLSIPSRFVLNINNVESEHDGTQGLIHIYTSQQLKGEDLSQYLVFDPKVKYSVVQEEYGVTLRSEQFDVDNSYSFTINMGLRGAIGGVLKEPYQETVAFGKLESDIKFTNGKAVYLSKKGGGKIEVRITNTPKVKLVISKIYENNLLMAERYGYYPQ
jgi:hypothetical protein